MEGLMEPMNRQGTVIPILMSEDVEMTAVTMITIITMDRMTTAKHLITGTAKSRLMNAKWRLAESMVDFTSAMLAGSHRLSIRNKMK